MAPTKRGERSGTERARPCQPRSMEAGVTSSRVWYRAFLLQNDSYWNHSRPRLDYRKSFPFSYPFPPLRRSRGGPEAVAGPLFVRVSGRSDAVRGRVARGLGPIGGLATRRAYVRPRLPLEASSALFCYPRSARGKASPRWTETPLLAIDDVPHRLDLLRYLPLVEFPVG